MMVIVKHKNLQYNVIFRPEPEGGFTVLVPSLPGCISYGKDLKEAKEMVVDAIECYIGSLEKHDEEIPPSDKENIVDLVSVTIPIYQKA